MTRPDKILKKSKWILRLRATLTGSDSTASQATFDWMLATPRRFVKTAFPANRADAGEPGWRIVRGAIMANHIHVVIADCPDDGPGVRRILKGNSQADLSDAAGATRRSWTQGGSDRYLHDHPSRRGSRSSILEVVVPKASGGV